MFQSGGKTGRWAKRQRIELFLLATLPPPLKTIIIIVKRKNLLTQRRLGIFNT